MKRREKNVVPIAPCIVLMLAGSVFAQPGIVNFCAGVVLGMLGWVWLEACEKP